MFRVVHFNLILRGSSATFEIGESTIARLTKLKCFGARQLLLRSTRDLHRSASHRFTFRLYLRAADKGSVKEIGGRREALEDKSGRSQRCPYIVTGIAMSPAAPS
jgi:hypothetical protein